MTPFSISLIKPEDDDAICRIIKKVGAEFGAIGSGFGPSDPEVLQMSHHFLDKQKSCYFIARYNEKIVGGGGIAPFASNLKCCELKKLFLLPEARGKGIGQALSLVCLEFARNAGYEECYLDTLKTMTAAVSLYEKLGFCYLTKPLDETVHGGCDVWMLKKFVEKKVSISEG